MKILVVISSLYTGGAEFSTLLFCQWLRKRGHDVKLVCYKSAQPQYDPALFDFPDYHTLSSGSILNRVRELNTIIKNYGPEIVHSVLFEANIVCRFSRMFNKRVVYLESLVNETYSPVRLHDPRVNVFKLTAYRYFDSFTQWFGTSHFHANSNSVAKHYRDKLMLPPRKISVVLRGRSPNPFIGKPEVRLSLRRELGISDDAIVLINVGRHEFQKGQDILLKALAGLDIPERIFRLLIAGREGNQTDILVKLVNSLGIADRVTFLGHRTDVPRLLAAADIFIFPSRFEGLPGALIEAEAAALPIIASDIPNNREVAIEGENAFYFSLTKPDSLGRLLRTMITDDGLRQRMAQRSLEVFKERFSLAEVHLEMENLYKNLLG